MSVKKLSKLFTMIVVHKHEPSLIELIEDGMDILGYFQSEKYFLHCEKEIREQFAFDTKEHMVSWHHVNKGTYDYPSVCSCSQRRLCSV